MRRSRYQLYRPAIEPLEPKLTLSAAPAAAGASIFHPTPRPPIHGVTLDRITNPHNGNQNLIPPFDQVMVQATPPVPGQMYNLLFLSVWNGTHKTFTAADGLKVKLSVQDPGVSFPVLTGNETWVPGQRLVFYVLTKKYYPLAPTASAGFQFNFDGNPRVTAIPGPSGIFLRIIYNPATFERMLNAIVVHGPGARGHTLGLPDTSIWETVHTNTVIPL
jgi:hypothetical protein